MFGELEGVVGRFAGAVDVAGVESCLREVAGEEHPVAGVFVVEHS